MGEGGGCMQNPHNPFASNFLSFMVFLRFFQDQGFEVEVGHRLSPLP